MILLESIRNTASFYPKDISKFKEKALDWADQFEIVSYLDSNQKSSAGGYEALLAVGCSDELIRQSNNAFDDLKAFYEEQKDWCFGFLTYDLKNDTEALSSENQDRLNIPDLHFFRPRVVVEIFDTEIRIHSLNKQAEELYQEIINREINSVEDLEVFNSFQLVVPELKARMSKAAYLQKVENIRQHIIAGDIYELNLCQEFYMEDTSIHPLNTFRKLKALTSAPFASYYKCRGQYLICASPERFIRKIKDQLISQPIKGTIRRGMNSEEDSALKEQLFYSKKDRSENVMIVDLVRNDLSRSCQAGSVKVDELFGIYTFEQVHQMISTVSGRLRPDVHFIDALKNCFPMGSMTGAPKIRAMELIEAYEVSRRGLYSGAVGYIRPDGDFDFNVVIRSLIYNQAESYLSFQVGGAIVFGSVPALEYEECLLKAKAILEVLGVSVEKKAEAS